MGKKQTCMREKDEILIFEKMQQREKTSRENMSGRDKKKGGLNKRRNICRNID